MQSYHLYQYDDYKAAIKDRVQHLKSQGQPVTFKKLADRIPIQYTFLSKVLNQKGHHLNNDHLFGISKLLDFIPEEIEFLDLLRSYASTDHADRKNFLYERISDLRRQKTIQAEHQGFTGSSDLFKEMKYLFDPMAPVVHISLFIPEYKADPRRLCSLTGITTVKLKEILNTLETCGYITLGEKPFSVSEVHERQPHFGRENPLMRAHQSKMKTHINSRMSQSAEEDKDSFIALFTADDETKNKIDEEFKSFLKKVRVLSMQSKSEHLFQLSYDFLKWL